MSKDATLERIWEARRRIYERCGNDPEKLVEHYLNRQREQLSEMPITPKDSLKQDHQEEVIGQ
jgi:hypothetical protein